MFRSIVLISILSALLAVICVVTGVKNYSVFHHASQYRLMIIEQKSAASFEHATVRSDEDTRGAVLRVADRIAWAPRYYVFHPSFEIADYLGTDVRNVFPFQIIVFLALFVGLVSTLGARFGTITTANGVATVAVLGVSVFALMNGRAAPAFVGYAVLAWTMVTKSGKSDLLRHAVLSVIGLVLCTMSSGIFLVALTFFVLCHLTPIGGWLRADVDKRWQHDNTRGLKTAIDLAIAFFGLLYAAVLIFRLGSFYGWDVGFVTGVLTHGAGRILLDLSLQSMFVILAICTLAGALLIKLPRIVIPLLKEASDRRTLLFLTVVPIPFVVVG